MKKALNAWTVPAQVPFEELFQKLSAAGYDGVELNLDREATGHALTMDTTSSQTAEIKKLSQAYNLPVHSISSSLYVAETLGSDDPACRRRGQDILRKQLELASALGADGILVVPGGVSDERSLTRAWDNSLESLSALKDEIVQSGVKVGVENVWNGFFLSPRDMATFIDTLDCPGIGAYFDVGNVEIFSNPQDWIEVLGSRIVKVHVKDFARTSSNAGHFVNLLEGSIDWCKVKAALGAAGYQGYLTAEVDTFHRTPEYQYEITKMALDHIISL